VYGYVRENITGKSKGKSGSPNELLNMVSLWFSLTDSWDVENTDSHIRVDNSYMINDETGNIDEKRIIERKVQWDTGLYHAFGTDIISRGQTKTWNLKIIKKDAARRKPYVLIGIMEHQTKLDALNRRIEGFVQNNGYCLYTASGKKYHNRISGQEFKYGQQFQYKVGDTISMELDLTRKMNNNNHKCGILKFIMNGQYEKEEEDHIAFNDIDINKQWIISVGLYFQDAVCLLSS